MKHTSFILVLLTIIFIFFSSCKSYKNFAYIQNSDTVNLEKSAVLYDMTIKPKDILSITFTSIDQETAGQLNRIIPSFNSKPFASTASPELLNYVVDNNGYINYSHLGYLHLANLTEKEAEKYIHDEASKFFNRNTDYQVHVRIVNYGIAVLGEVKSPNWFTIPNEKINIFEALALAGDITIYGQRENIKLIRLDSNGGYSIHQLDLTDANILNSPYYYLQQRDILYIEPNNAIKDNSRIGTTTRLYVRGISIVVSLGSLLYRILK